jgi:hypothetical protein
MNRKEILQVLSSNKDFSVSSCQIDNTFFVFYKGIDLTSTIVKDFVRKNVPNEFVLIKLGEKSNIDTEHCLLSFIGSSRDFIASLNSKYEPGIELYILIFNL